MTIYDAINQAHNDEGWARGVAIRRKIWHPYMIVAVDLHMVGAMYLRIIDENSNLDVTTHYTPIVYDLLADDWEVVEIEENY